MSCQSSNENQCPSRGGTGYVIIIVLYILLAIILGACVSY